MAYLLFSILSSVTAGIWGSRRLSRSSNLFFFLFFVLLYAFLPALQWDVGTDYSTYYDLAAGERSIVVYWNKGEFLFYYIFDLLSSLNVDPQIFFILASIINAFLVANFLRLIKINSSASLFWIVVYLFVASGVFHNQLNIIRTYTAIFVFFNAFAYKISGAHWKCVCFVFIGFVAHQSFALVLPLLLIPVKMYAFLYRFPLILFFFSSFFYLFVLTPGVASKALELFLPFYSKYTVRLDSGHGLSLNFLTKAYYIPFILVVLWFFKVRRVHVESYLKPFFVVWLITAGMFISLYNTGLIFRAYNYFALFAAFPFALLMARVGGSTRILIFLYFFFPYLVKVFLLPEGEYHYKSILGPICEPLWSLPQC